MQFFLYLVVGGLSFLVEIGSFLALRWAAMPIIAASMASFMLATGANYLLCTLLAFEGGRFRRHSELLRFMTVVLVGLAFNTALVWCFVYPFGIHPTVAKIAAVPIVLAWNYFGRRLLVFGDRIPAPVRSWINPVRRAAQVNIRAERTRPLAGTLLAADQPAHRR
jgi:putative flippase GtrA